MRTTRLAPSPTGDLHLGNLRTFLLTWLIARARGWRLAMRVEDLDTPRVRPGSVEATLDLLRWLGLDHDGAALRQSDDLTPYRDAMRTLAARGSLYSCPLSRADVRRLVSAPHAGEREQCYPARLRPLDPSAWRFENELVNHRFATEPGEMIVDDAIAGRHAFDPASEVGDFVVWTKQGVPAYQLAVVVDDARQGVTDVIRGDDLLPSAARQARLHAALGAPAPHWWHVPLVLDERGERLAKRADSASAAFYRAAGVRPERLLGLLAWWLGLLGAREPIDLAALLEQSAARLRADTLVSLRLRPVAFTAEDHRWLLP